MVFPVVLYDWELYRKEGRTPNNWCLRTLSWRSFLRVPWTARRSNQSILREIHPEYSLEGLMLKLQHFGHLMHTDDSLEKSPMLGKIKGRRRRGCQRIRWLGGNEHELAQTPGDGEGQGGLASSSPWGHKESDTTGQLNNNDRLYVISGLPPHNPTTTV